MIHEIPACGGAAFHLKKGQKLRVVDPYGKQVSDLFCVSFSHPLEVLSSGRSIDDADNIFLTTGNSLFSNHGNPMLKIVEDMGKRHDFILPPCSKNEQTPNCTENLLRNFKYWGVSMDCLATTFNIFMNVAVDDGKIDIQAPKTKAGDHILFLAMMDLLVGLTACSHPASNAGECKPIQYEITN